MNTAGRMRIVQKYYPQVKQIVDATEYAEFEVTADDARRSKSKAPNSCALATACKREYDGAIISMSVTYLIKGDKALRYEVPVPIARELVSFDRHKDFAPGRYWLKPPCPSLRIGADQRRRLRKRGNEPKTRTLGKSKHHHKTTGIRAL